MSSLLSNLLNNARKAEIGFGVHANCLLVGVTNEARKKKDGGAMGRNSYTKFAQLGPDGKVVAEREISWFDIDASTDYAFDSFISQVDQMTGIIDAYFPIEEGEEDNAWSEAFDKILAKHDIEHEADTVEEEKELLKQALKNKKTLAAVMADIADVYVELLTDVVNDKDKLVRLKIVYDPKGQNLGQPRFDQFVESMSVEEEDSRLKITATEEGYKAKNLENAKKPATGAQPGKI